MRFSSSPSRAALVALTALVSSGTAIELDVSNQASIRNAAGSVAHGLMSYYKNNQSSTPAIDVGTFAMPVYWWQAGAVWGGMVDYFAYTKDASYVEATSNAIMAQIGPDADFLVPQHKGQEGNDDQVFWALTVMSAAENGFPQPGNKPLWGDIAKNAFNNMVPRWDTASCKQGGFRWQIYPENNYGYNYKNSISNGGFFQLAARLGHYTGNATYTQWAEKVWNWSVEVGFITKDYQVLDGADVTNDCTKIDHNRWTYNTAIYLYGCAAMYSQTGDAKWLERTNGLLKAASYFFTQEASAPNVMSEAVCAKTGKCNADQSSFRAYLARWMAKTSVLIPSTAGTIKTYLEASANAAAKSCAGGACGLHWTTGGFDGNTGVGQHLSALEVIQGLLANNGGAPLKSGEQPVQQPSSSTVVAQPTTTSAVQPTTSSVVVEPTTTSVVVVVPTTSDEPVVVSTSSTAEAIPTSTTDAPQPSTTIVDDATSVTDISGPIATSSGSPIVFPQVSASFCSEEVTETVTVTVEPTPLFPTSSSFCTEEVVTVTVTVSESETPIIPTAIVPPFPIGTGSSSSSLSLITPTPIYPYPTGTGHVVFPPTGASSGFLSATPPPTFTGAASPRAQGSNQLMGAMAVLMGLVAMV